jgi:hypothetical protein
VKKPAGLGENLKRLFRNAVKALTRREPTPMPKSKRRRSGETDKAFRMVVKEITLRRAVSRLAERARHFVWETLHWLHLWEWNGTDEFEDADQDTSHTNSDFSPHP